MPGQKVIIIGGVAGGASAAARLRRLNEGAEIIIIERGPFVSFANCGLPYYIGKTIKDREALELMTPERFKERFNIEVRVLHEAKSLDSKAKSVSIQDLETGEIYAETYDWLVFSPGAAPIKPNFPGLEDVPYYTLRNIPDTEAIYDFIADKDPKRAVVVGGGFIGLEMAENLVQRNIDVTIVELLDQVMAPLDREMAQFVHQELILNGVNLVLGDGVKAFRNEPERGSLVVTNSGKNLQTDLVILAIGVRPESTLAREAGLKLDERGHVLVDGHMKTSDPHIYAVGDVIAYNDFQTGTPTPYYLAGPANKQGRIVADNIAGRDVTYSGSMGAAVVKVFDTIVSQVGLNEKKLKSLGTSYEKIYLHPNNHAGYYPDAIPLAMKLLFEVPAGKVLGVQIVGGPGTEKRVDVIATAIRFGATVFDLEELELTYAPPVGSAKDPVNMAGFIASNYLRGDMPIWHWHDVPDILANQGYILDVREEEEYEVGHIEGAVNVPDLNFRDHLDKLPQDKSTPIYIHCQVGFRGYLVTRLLQQLGYSGVANLTGGYKTYDIAKSTIEDFKEMLGVDLSELVKERVALPPEDVGAAPDILDIDAVGLSCPGPLNALINTAKRMPIGKVAQIRASDPGFPASAVAWINLTEGIELLSLRKRGGQFIALVKKAKELVGIPVDETIHEELEVPAEMPKVPPPPPKMGRKRPSGVPSATTINVDELCERMQVGEGPRLLLDVRQEGEYTSPIGHIPGSTLVPLGELQSRLDEIEEYKNEEIVTVCHSGMRSMLAARMLAQMGFDYVRSLNGGMIAWRTEKCLPVDR